MVHGSWFNIDFVLGSEAGQHASMCVTVWDVVFEHVYFVVTINMVRWPSGLRRQTKDLVRKGVGSNPTLIIFL